MKKLVFFAFISIIILSIVPSFGKANSKDQVLDLQVIPDEAIRLRILANSDSEVDQELKRKVRDHVSDTISLWVKDIADIDEARALIASREDEIGAIVKSVLKAEKVDYEFTVDYSKDIVFPAKLYGTYIYPAGNYEAVLITIGAGTGANWWCVLFPPLCFLDFGSGATVAEASTTEAATDQQVELDEEPVKVKFFLFEWLGW